MSAADSHTLTLALLKVKLPFTKEYNIHFWRIVASNYSAMFLCILEMKTIVKQFANTVPPPDICPTAPLMAWDECV